MAVADISKSVSKPRDGRCESSIDPTVMQSAARKHGAFDGLELQIESALCRFRQREFHGFLNVLPEGIAICSPGNVIEFANSSLTAMLDLEESPTGRNLVDLVFSSSDPLRNRMLQNCTAVVELSRGSEIADGVWRVARYPVQSGTDQTGCVWTIRNITQQKLVEDMRDHFVTAATHELRTPLANIRAYAETLLTEDDIDLEQEKQFINVIDGEAARLSRFVDDLLNVSQMQAGSLALDRHQVDLMRLVSEVDAKVRPLMEAKSLEFEMVIPPKLPQIHADKDKLSAALVNLLGNAAKYTNEGGVKFTIELRDNDICFHVEDTGVGISDDEIPKLFDRFFRSDDRRVRAVEGNGLGLSLTNDVIRLHGGRIEVHSELDRGSRFTAIFPNRRPVR